MARVLLRPLGQDSRWVLLGMMLITAMFSMFMSNTAITAMMLAIVAPVLALFAAEDRGRVAFALAIPLAANVGGMGTPISTPPNALAHATGMVNSCDMAKVGGLPASAACRSALFSSRPATWPAIKR